MTVRGYGGKISGSRADSFFGANDAGVFIIGLLIFAVVIGTLFSKTVLELSTYTFVLSIAALIISSIYRNFSA